MMMMSDDVENLRISLSQVLRTIHNHFKQRSLFGWKKDEEGKDNVPFDESSKCGPDTDINECYSEDLDDTTMAPIPFTGFWNDSTGGELNSKNEPVSPQNKNDASKRKEKGNEKRKEKGNEKKKGKKKWIITIAVVVAIITIIVIATCWYCLYKRYWKHRARKRIEKNEE